MPEPHLWIPLARTRIEPANAARRGTSYSREDVAEHSRALLTAFSRSMERFSEKHDFDVATDLIVQITTAPGRSVSSERQHLRNLGFEIIAFSEGASNIGIARIRRESVPKLTKKLQRYAGTPKHIGKGNFAAIEAISPVAVEQKIEPALLQQDTAVEASCLISLFGTLPVEMKNIVADRLLAELRDAGKSGLTVHRYSNGAVGVGANLTRADIERVAEQFMFVRAIEANSEVVVEAGVQADPVPQLIQVDIPRCEMPVVVVDSGINANCSLMAGLVARVINELPPNSHGPHLAHGTFVASRVIYGDEITNVRTMRASPWCRVIDVQVTGDDGLGNRIPWHSAELGDVLERVVPAIAKDAKVINLSLGTSPISDGRYSTIARLIDFLSREYQVLFVIAAGNINQLTAQPPAHYLAPESRVLCPSESLLALTVGSVAKFTEQNAVARVQEISPFSRRGPGADRALKPELAAHGGNVLLTGSSFTTSPRIAAYGLGRAGTHLEYSMGTSFSAPIVSQYAARLFDAYPGATPNLVRALLCHFTDPVIPPVPGTPICDHDFCGFGEPNVDGALYAGAHSTGYLFTGEIPKDHYMFLPFHVPAALADAAGSKLMVRGTIVFDPPVSLDDAVDYSLCRIAGLLRKRGESGLRNVAIGGDEDDARYPWNPLFHFAHRFRRGYATGEWELRLRLMTRGNLPADFKQSFAVVIEVMDEGKHVDVRQAILSEVPTYAPVALRVAA